MFNIQIGMDATMFKTLFLTCQILVISALTINTPSGDINGGSVMVEIENQEYTVYTFLGIPYAKPPVNDLRFRRPEPLDTAYNGFSALKISPKCPQTGDLFVDPNSQQSEDCLYLNIYVPARASDSASGHAVMIWIHGGGFIAGSGGDYDGALLAHAGNVIVVTFNYRMGALGFFSTMDENMPPNLGLWDQRLAIQWVNSHIASFGGETDRITIFGESAGAISCSLHSIYPKNNGLFQRVILESGTATMMVSDSDVSPAVRLLASKLACDTIDTEKMVECLKNKTWEDITATASQLQISPEGAGVISFTPVVDGDFIVHDPRKLYKTMKTRKLDEIEFYQSLDVLNGFNSYDGALMLFYTLDPTKFDEFRPTQEFMLNDAIPQTMQLPEVQTYPESLYKLILAEYTNWTNPESIDSVRLQYIKLFTDMFFSVPAVAMNHIHQHENMQGKIYAYEFMPKPSVHLIPTPTWVPGANHADEIAYVFGMPTLLEPWEKNLSKTMIMLWSSFAKTGHPTSDGSGLPYWQEWKPDTQYYMELDKIMNGNSLKQFVAAKEVNFWLDVLPGISDAVSGDNGGYSPCSVSSASLPSAGTVAMTLMAIIYVLWYM